MATKLASKADSLFGRALASFQQGRLGDARELSEQTLRLQPRHFNALILSGVIALQTSHPEQAIELFGKAILVDPRSAAARNNLGNAHFLLKQYEAAIASYDKAIALDASGPDAHYNRGTALRNLGRNEAAVAAYDRAIALKPNHADAHNNRGNALRDLGQCEAAVESYDKAIAVRPSHAETYSNRGNALLDLRRYEAAIASYDQAIAINPNHAEAFNNRGNALRSLQRYEAAVASYDRAISFNPDNADAYYNRGNALLDLKQREAAVACYDKAIASNPNRPEAFNNRGVALRDLKHYAAAIANYDRAIALSPDYAEAHYNRGNALRELKRPEAAIASYNHSIAISPNNPAVHSRLGLALSDLRRHQAAIASYDRAIAINPSDSEAYNNRGISLYELKEYEAAIASYDRAIEHNSEYADAYNNRGICLYRIKQYQAAIDSFAKAIAIQSDHAEAYNNRGNAFLELSRYQEAIASYDKAIACKADYAEAHHNCGHAFLNLKQYEAAIARYDKALALKSDFKGLRGVRQHLRMQICEWDGYEPELALLTAGIERGEVVSNPSCLLGLSDSASLQRKAAEIWRREEFPASDALSVISKSTRHDKIQIGYFSADFHNHATSYLMAGLLEQHDRSRFELSLFSYGPDQQDAMRQRLTAACKDFIDVRQTSDREVATLARDRHIDIAIDLKGFTQDGRLGIFALRAAPLQVAYLGYPGTLGAEYIDYLVADLTLIPETDKRHYSEKIIYLPNSYQVNDAKRSIASRVFTRSELGLPPTGFIFCCFNNSYKITPRMFESWMRILRRVEGSVLWLLEDNPKASSNLRLQAAQRQVNPERLIFAKRMPMPEHLARHRMADLFIDTVPCNAHTTASDALWAGLPVLTCVGEAFASRVAASLLDAVHLPELVTSTLAQYEEVAIELASNSRRLAEISRKLATERVTGSLFDTRLFTTHIETAYMRIFERYQADLPPEHIYVE
jgi:protein O-GlcNAc transferase